MFFFNLAILALFNSVSGCGKTSNESNQQAIKELEQNFAVTWPTQIVHEYGGSLSTLRSTDVYARLEVDQEAFESWRESVTNKLEEVPYNGSTIQSDDESAAAHFSWWDCYGMPGKRFTVFRNNLRVGGPVRGILTVLVLNTNGLNVMYIHGLR
jgi:hypothetical protein